MDLNDRNAKIGMVAMIVLLLFCFVILGVNAPNNTITSKEKIDSKNAEFQIYNVVQEDRVAVGTRVEARISYDYYVNMINPFNNEIQTSQISRSEFIQLSSPYGKVDCNKYLLIYEDEREVEVYDMIIFKSNKTLTN